MTNVMFRLLVLAVLCLELHGGSAPAAQLSSQSTIHLNVAKVPSTAFQFGLGKWSHGVYIRLDKSQLARPTFYLFDGAGQQISAVAFAVPDAERVYVKDFDVAPDHTIVLCGDSYSADGRAAYFIARISPGGDESNITRTTPYWPFLASAAPDGTVWTLGVEYIIGSDDHPLKSKSNPVANVLRHYDKSGNLIISACPRSEFRSTQLTTGYLVATRDRVGWYSPKNGQGNYFEASPDGKSIKSYPGMPGKIDGPDRVSGFALTDEGNAFLTFDTSGQKTRTTYMLDRASGNWVTVDVPNTSGGKLPMLKGSLGESLVFAGADLSSLQLFGVSQ